MKNQSNSFFTRQKLVSLIILSFFAGSLFIMTPQPVYAQTDFNQAVNNVLTPIWSFLKKAYEKGGASAFQKTVRTALNKVAFDTATWLGSGREGQKPMFVNNFWGYIGQVGDEAAGSFIEDAVNNWKRTSDASLESNQKKCNTQLEACKKLCGSLIEGFNKCNSQCDTTFASCFNEAAITANGGGTVTTGRDGVTGVQSINTVAVCQPSSIDAKLKIAMGLVDYNRPQAPNCSASTLISNWSDSIERMTAFEDPNFLDKFANLFNPVSNDLGIYYTLRTDMTKKIDDNVIKTEKKLIADGGWLDMQDIAGNYIGMPGDAETRAELKNQGYINNMATFSGDALIDAANVFLNQLAMTAYNKYMLGLGKVVSSNSSGSINNASSDPNIRYGETVVKESAANIIEPDFGVRADYDILSTLSMCRDRENPGPTDCVIDDKLMQAITEKKTVAEAVKDGYLHKNWLFSADYREGNYNLRNLEIMRKYRLIPVSWEVAAAANKQASLIDLMSCFSASDDYNEYSSNFNVGNQTWCRNLVDPNWVLKAPLNYCAKQGYSAQIFDISVIPTGIEGQADTIQITRADGYCADEQSCIQERADGSCEAYGYCQSERRTWSFDSKSCEPINNTCSAFINANSNQRIAYLENTLDYANCSADSVGCKRYSLFGIYDEDTSQVNWSESANNKAYFNNNLSNCSASDEGCTEMIRVKPGWGLNLIMGADFADDNIGDTLVNSKINNYWNVWAAGNKEAEIIDIFDLNSFYNGKVLFLNSEGNSASSTIGIFSNNAMPLIPTNFNILSDETYTLSADIYIKEGDNVDLILGDYLTVARVSDREVWRHVSVTRNLKDKPLSELNFSITGYAAGPKVAFAVRNMKLEMTAWDSGFSSYGSFKVYEQLIPSYLADACYVNADPGNPDYRLRADALSICDNYARQCNREEVGCERYQEASTGFSVAAQAVSSDYCDATCNGYDLYVSKSSYFYSPFVEKMIPENSDTCSSEAAGCSEFTNLDAIAAGGEGLEYYTELKQCIKPSDSCANFYTWVGTEESGYQLKSLSLEKDTSDNPAVIADDSQICSQEIFNLTPSDPSFNADCRQFYNKAGNISYHLSSYTITCSENCHAYRLTENNIDSTLTQADCNGSDRSWNTISSVCYVCKNGGTWNGQDHACIYQAIPNEGKKCSASQNGCREYNGSLGNNIQMLGAYSFETGLDGWEGQCGDAAMSSQVVSTNNGHSLLYDKGANITGSIQATDCEDANVNISWLDKFLDGASASFSHIRRFVGYSVVQGQAYNVKFTASAAVPTNVQVALMNAQGEISYFNTSDVNTNGAFVVSGNNEWRTYELNLADLDHEVDSGEFLIIVADHDFYLDNFILTAISDRYYLIKDSSDIPDVCYYDLLDNYQGADYNLGCSLYRDRAGSSHYLRQFSKLCQNSAVGCELMINTANYNDYKSGIWQDTNGNGVCNTGEDECIKVEGDRFFYAIYDESKRCNSADLGCSRLGESLSTGINYDWSDIFGRNNPNNYDQILCAAADAGCEAWNYIDGSGISYFKNSGNDACVYRISSDPTKPGKAWYKVPVMRCDLDDSGKIDGNEIGKDICSTNNDCADDSSCLVDNNDYDCLVSYFETFGFGGGGNQVPTPLESAALCETANSGCSEYIDPVSTFSENLISDPAKENGSSSWPGNHQDIVIEPNKIYIFSVNTPESLVTMDFDVKISFPVGVYLLQEDNTLSTVATTTLIIPQEQPHKRIMFHSRTNTSATVSGASSAYEILLKAAILDYQFKQNIDKSSCNGIVNFDNGCVLFNERSINGAQGVLSLSGGWNAFASEDGQTPVLCSGDDCSANQLIKVRPDRVCSSWLDCLTYAIDPDTQEKTCYALGLCNQLNDNDECSNFVNPGDTKLLANGVNINRLTGYSLLNQYNLAFMKEVGLNTEAHYDFEAGTQSLDCKVGDAGVDKCVFDYGLVVDSIVNSPNNAPTDYPAEGAAYLQVMVGQRTSPHSLNSPISVQAGQDYYLNYLVNTKGSGYEAAVYIYDHAKLNYPPIATDTTSSSNGWERKVFKISMQKLEGVESINIYLGANSSGDTEERYIYFDDINIEPVLRVADDEYVAKECRLYPSQDATSCTSKNSQVVSDGLVGYCLQHDLANPSVCLVWYPVDEISSASKSGRSGLGYQGAFPLNYCTEANGNFDLVEKRISVRLDDAHSTDENEWGEDRCTVTHGCQGDQNYDTMIEINNGDVSSWARLYCVPNPDKLLFITEKKLFGGADSCKDQYLYEGWDVYDGLQYIQSGQSFPVCGNNCDINCNTGTCKDLDESTTINPNIRVFDYDHPTMDEDQLKLISSNDTDKVFYPSCNQFVQVVDAAGNNKAWAGRTSKTSIYPFNTPLFFRYQDIYYGLGSGCYLPDEGECLEYCTCDNGCICIPHHSDNCSGECAGKIVGDCKFYAGVPVSCDTPGSISYPEGSEFDMTAYGRNRSLVPFGAAAFPDNFNILASEPVKFLNQYSGKIDQKAFAGRPYGCSGVGCDNIGYCSLNPNVMCLLDTTDSADTSLINQKSCGSANGTCVSLWNGENIANDDDFDVVNVLKNIFNTAFGQFDYNSRVGNYVSNGDSSVYNTNYIPNQHCTSSDYHLSSSDGDYYEYNCAIWPRINSVKLDGFTVPSTINPGIHVLSFNTTIDTEQQPLKDLIIDWGDDSVQNLVNQDHHPDGSTPHRVYHYYADDTNGDIKIKVTDNWNTFCCVKNGSSCAAANCP